MKLTDEVGRQSALDQYDVLDTPPEKEFDDIVNLLRTIFGVEYAAVNLVDRDRQWAKAVAGMNSLECPREDSFCTVTINGYEPMEVNDASVDDRFRDNIFVVGAPNVRCYLGVPLTTPQGYNIGALCVFGSQIRTFTSAEHDIMKNFAKVVMSQLELRHSADDDVLTGVLTRRAFSARIARQVATGAPASLVIIDIDHFKSINDTWGHAAGDDALKAVTESIAAQVRRSDAVGRLGGEEFAVLLPNTGLAEATAFAERMRSSSEELRLETLGNQQITISLGVTERNQDETVQAWMERGDAALYRAKRSGRNRVVTD